MPIQGEITQSDHSPRVVEQLEKCILFSRLDGDTVAGIASQGFEARIRSGQTLGIGDGLLGFLNVIVSGRITAEYEGFSLYGGPADLSEGRSFGSIDTVLGVGKFTKATAQSDAVLFSIHRESLRRLLETSPDLKTHLSHIRAAIAVRTAESYRRRMAEMGGPETSGLRIAPRFSVWERNMGIQLTGGELWKVENLSASGLFVAGKPPGPPGTEFPFRVRPGIRGLAGVSLNGKVKRVDPGGFGILITQIEEGNRLRWEEVVLQAMSLEIAEIFRPDLTQLEKPRAACATAGRSMQDCEILSLGTEGAVLRFSKDPPQGEFLLAVNLTLLDGARTMLNASSRVMAARGNEFLVQFAEISPLEESWIQQWVAAARGAPKVEPKPQADAKPAETRAELIQVENQKEMNSLFVREISNNNLILYSELKHLAGETVRIRVKLLFTPLSDQAGRSEFDFVGTVVRILQGNALVELHPSCLPEIAALKKLVGASNRQGLERDFRQQVHVEHDTEHRRYVQLVLILGLLAACAWWAWEKILSGSP